MSEDTQKTEEGVEETPVVAATPVAEEAEVEVEVPSKFKALVDQVESMSVLELHELVKLLEKKFGVSAAAVAVAGPAAADAGEEKTSFNVELVSDGGSKIPVMKVIKEELSLGLKEAKELVESAPVVIKEGVKKEDAEALKAKIEEAGGKVELK